MRPDGERSLGQELGTALRRMALPVVLIGGVVVLLGLLFTRVLDNSDVSEADTWIGRELAEGRTPTGNDLTHYGSLLGETPTIIGLTALAAIIFRVVFKRWRESVLIVLCVSAQALIFMVTQMLIDRQRPAVPRLDDSPPTSGFPSGHTAAATALYLGVGLIVAWHTRHTWLKWLALALGVLLPLTVAFCRMYRGMHYATDASTSVLLSVSLLAVATRLLPFSTRAAVTGPRALVRRR
jgi:undecaprenyl-diphosphatase